MSIQVFSILRQLGLGGLAGGSLLCLIQLRFPEIFPGHPSIETVALVGGGVGLVVHRLISGAFDWLFLRPFLAVTHRFGPLVRVMLLIRVIPPAKLQKQMDRAIDRFLAD